MRGTNTDSQFVAGFVSAFLLLTVFTGLLQAAAWLRTNPYPQALFEFLNRPLFSILDLFTAFVVLLILFVVLTAPALLPRPGTNRE